MPYRNLLALPLRGLAILALLGLAAVPVSAGWAPVIGAPGKPAVELHLDPDRPELLYARAAGGFLWRSVDAGTTWRSLQTGLGRSTSALAIDPADPEVIWAWTPAGELWRSGDAGETWARRFASPAGPELPRVVQLLVDPRRPETVYRVKEDFQEGDFGLRVAVSRDGGASFQEGAFLPRVFYGDPVSVNPRRGELLSFNEKGFDVSADGGRTWRTRGRFHGKGFSGGAVAPSDPNVLYALPAGIPCLARSDDGGAHWQRTACPRLPEFSFGFYRVAADPRNARHVWLSAYVAPEQGYAHWIFESKDGGETWAPPFSMPSTGVVPAGGRLVYTGVTFSEFPENGLYESQGGGRHWRPKDQGIVSGDLRNPVALLLPDGRRRLLALASPGGGVRGGLFRSDGGTAWVRQPLRASWILGAGDSAVVAVAARGIVHSENGGETWSAAASTPPDPNVLLADLNQPRYLAVHSFVENDAFGDLYLWTSDDGGATWRLSSAGLPVACTHVASVDYCTGYSGYAVDPFDPDRRWLASAGAFFGSSEIFASQDAGASWHRVAVNLPAGITVHDLAADLRFRDRLLAATSAGFLVSEDGGAIWGRRGHGLPDGSITQLVRDRRAGTWYAAMPQHGIYRSVDSGASWTLLPGVPDVTVAPTLVIDPRRPTALLAAFPGQGLWIWRD